MKLWGRYNSPYVRRVAVTMQLYGLEYQHESVIPFDEGKKDVAKVNPIARVPVLELPDGETLVDSAAIIDHLDELAGPERALTPATGPERRKVLKYVAVELGIMDKLVAVLYERQFRPKEKWHRPWIDACEGQIRDGFKWIDNEINGNWLLHDRLTQADVSLAVFWDFATRLRPNFFAKFYCNDIVSITEKLRHTDAFIQTEPTEDALSAKMPDAQGKDVAE